MWRPLPCDSRNRRAHFQAKMAASCSANSFALWRKCARSFLDLQISSRAEGVAHAGNPSDLPLDFRARWISGRTLHRRDQMAADGESRRFGIEVDGGRAMLLRRFIRVAISSLADWRRSRPCG